MDLVIPLEQVTIAVEDTDARTSRIKRRGERLDEYINNVWKRLAVMHCLADP